ncbi:MAG TPA: acyl-CoA dehydrogenase family protein [Dehalococcoidia bacterium]|nr:acyl-CoA dehydrogenase family protein [Dehalococcoidia bacterium]
MDFRFTPEQERWRHEIRSFIVAELPPEIRDDELEPGSEEAWQAALNFTRKLAGRRWLGAAWPKEYGGLGLSIIEQMIYSEEMAYHRAPNVSLFGLGFVGPTILTYGTPEQKARHIPAILQADVIWAQGFSEPGSGSDLASLRTRAVEQGDEWVITGQKIWATQAHHSQWMLLGARTNPDAPKHKGISLFLVPLDAPGIAIRPLINLAGTHGFNEVFFEDVRIPRDHLLGERDRGWYQMATTLDFERSAISGSAGARRILEELTRYARRTVRDGRPLAEDPLIRSAFAQLFVETEVARMMSYRVASLQAAGRVPNHEASAGKLFVTELSQRIAQFGLKLLGLAGPVRRGSRWAPLKGRVARLALLSTSATIAGGTSEIQRNVIATRGLGLPR